MVVMRCAVQEERTGAEEESRKARELRLAAAMKDKHTREEQIQYVLWLTVVACALCHREETAYLTVQTTAAELEAALETLPNIDDVDVFRSAATGLAGYNGCAGCWQLQKQ